MDTERKPRSDAKLKTLPEERQAQIAGMLGAKSLDEVRAELRRDGLNTSVAALSDFFTWYRLRETTRRREERVAGLLDEMRNAKPDIDEEQLFAFGQSVFSSMAIAEEDSTAWARTQTLGIERRSAKQRGAAKERELELRSRAVRVAEEKLEILRAQLDRVRHAVLEAKVGGGLTPEALAKIEEAAKLL